MFQIERLEHSGYETGTVEYESGSARYTGLQEVNREFMFFSIF